MQRKKLEAVAEAIVRTSGYLQADSGLYQSRNPGGLRAYGVSQARDEEGFRTFGSMLDGMQALLFDVSLKLEGRSKAGLKPSDTLSDFAVACGQPATAAVAWSAFLRKALRDHTLSQKSALQQLIGDE